MCGIVGAIAERNIVPVLVEGLKRLEYRGYDSAGLAVVQGEPRARLAPHRRQGRAAREPSSQAQPLAGRLGVAHTRWATHGGVTEANAHPHLSGDRVAVIHNGIIENYEPLKDELIAKGYEFKSETDTEVAAHLIHDYLKQGHDLLEALRLAVAALRRRVRAARVRRQGPRAHRRHAHREPARHRARHRRELRRERRAGAPARHAAVHLSRAGRHRRDHARRRAHLRRAGPARDARRPRDAVEPGGRREGAVPALHAQGDLRAAERARRHAVRARRQQARRARVARAARRRAAAEGAEHPHRRVRHELSRRQRRPLLVRVDRRRAVPGRDRERVPLSQRRRAAEHAVPDAVAVRRDGRHARSAAHGEDRGLLGVADDLQQPAQLDGARVRSRHDDAGRAPRSASRAPRRSRRSSCRCCS